MDLKGKVKSFIQFLKQEKKVPIPQPINCQKILEGKTALITGGSGGLGLAFARAFKDVGCFVIIAGTNERKLKECRSNLGKDVSAIVIDINDVNSLENKVKEAVLLSPDKKIDILVNSAGLNKAQSFINVQESDYDRIMNVNAKGTFFMCQAMAKYMISNNIKGHILNVSSSSALRPAWTPYEISKWALNGFTKGLADVLLPYGIIVNAIAPGPTATPMLDKKEGDSISNFHNLIGRFEMPSEIANLAVFMVSDMGNMIVGDTFYISGGSGVISMHR
nr:SDR family oxidoreductase [uncultured Anaerostipes sp.]